MLIAAMSTRAKLWKEPRCPSTDEWIKKMWKRGIWVAQSVKHLPLTQVMIQGSWDWALHQAPCSAESVSPSSPCSSPCLCTLVLSLSQIKFFKRFYLFMRDTERKRQRHRQGEAGSMQGAWSGTPSQNSGIMPWVEGGCSAAEPPKHPSLK